MNILVFKTDIKTRQRLQKVEWIFNQHPFISDWNVDFQDIDKILRIEALESLNESDVVDISRTFGFACEALPD